MRKSDRLLLESIFGKWNPICMGCMEDLGGGNCPLCTGYVFCSLCPVGIETGLTECNNTPYQDYYKTASKYPWCCVRSAEAAEAEVEYLISLLSKKYQKSLEALYLKWVKAKKKGLRDWVK